MSLMVMMETDQEEVAMERRTRGCRPPGEKKVCTEEHVCPLCHAIRVPSIFVANVCKKIIDPRSWGSSACRARYNRMVITGTEKARGDLNL